MNASRWNILVPSYLPAALRMNRVDEWEREMTQSAVKPNATIEYLSDPETVSMADAWYEYASIDHFWMKRRFDVFQRLAQRLPEDELWADIGCGHGAVQTQLQNLGIIADGIDLNQLALQQNDSQSGRLLCYNIFQQRAEMQHAYDGILLFDVLEHMTDDGAFLDAALHMVKPGGRISINVPAFMYFYSEYDVVAGHVRRYDFAMMDTLLRNHGLVIDDWTYWGAPLVPLLIMRKAYLKMRKTEHVIRDGFAVGNKLMNRLLGMLAQLEWIPQHWFGTSLMVIATKPE